MILLERLRNRRVHITELRAMALIENQYDMLAVDRVRLVLLDEHGELLNRRDDDARRIIRELTREHARRRIAVRRALFGLCITGNGSCEHSAGGKGQLVVLRFPVGTRDALSAEGFPMVQGEGRMAFAWMQSSRRSIEAESVS